MGTLAALLVATPIFGLSLDIDPSLSIAPLTAVASDEAIPSGDGDAEEAVDDAPAAAAQPSVAEQMQQRGRIAKIHKWMGISTWVSMTATLFLGWIQYYNLYGFFAPLEETPCVTGDAVFGQGQCIGTPLPHLTSAIMTTALYSVTFGLSYRMPDPMNLSEGEGEYAKNLRMHKLLRWVHFVGMIAQLGLGIVIANGSKFGLDRTNDFGTLQALSTVHLGIGMVTWGALTWAGTIMVF